MTTEFKIVFTGDPSVGKTSLIYQMIEGKFHEELPSTIPESQQHTVTEGNQIYVFNLNDTAGQEVYRTVTSSYYRSCHGVFLVYAQDDKTSFEDLRGFFDDITTYTKGKKPIIYLLSNKKDCEKIVSTEQGQKFAKEKKIVFFEVSAKTGEGVKEAFENMQTELKGTGGNKKGNTKSGKCILL
ncbi:hypothetical protein ENUP19_0100G0012 [Entamoeba nuttalli]|uniref:Rab family GTPase n=1 Tax=Entamoeba nuttalli TaxID=412467 RepID=A0ABQ0DHD6_9EUKA